MAPRVGIEPTTNGLTGGLPVLWHLSGGASRTFANAQTLRVGMDMLIMGLAQLIGVVWNVIAIEGHEHG